MNSLKDGHPYANQYNSSVHGTTGPVHISVDNYKFPTQDYVINSAGGLPGYEYSPDANDGNPLGLGWVQSNNGVSQSTRKSLRGYALT